MKLTKRIICLLLALLCCLPMLMACETPSEGDVTTDAGTEESGEVSGEVTEEGDEYPVITVARALELCGEAGNLTTERYYLKVRIESVDNPAYGQMTVSDETGSISVYGTYSADGSVGYAELTDKPYKGDTVLIHCTLQNYNGQKEVKNARLIKFWKNDAVVDEKDYTSATVAEAREAEVGAKLKLSGTVARITYANGMKPAGVFLIDSTESIYVYDADLAGRVKIGNKVTLLGSKTYWILESEKQSAEKFGYKGCCQIEDVTVVSIDDGVSDFDKSWIKTSTVKAILNTPVTENVTSTVYKVTALVKKVPGNGFVNYYFYDLDGETGAYTYTQCNGSDFAWLDEFDGKICTVYLSPLNAKSKSTECFFRFVPVSVIDEGFKFDLTKTAEHVVEYYGLTQFMPSYTGNPEIVMVESVSSALLGFEDATLEYSSSDENVVFFSKNADGKVVFNCKNAGKATVTVKGKHGTTEFVGTTTVKVVENVSVNTITVEAAQKSSVDTTVTVRGIVGPSLVNKDGFYLFDSTGMIAVVVKSVDQFNGLQIGNEIVLTGRRDCFKDADKTHAGQTCISNAEVVANYYGSHDYPTAGFITDKTLADIHSLNVNEDHTTEVYVVKATVKIVETAYYTSIKLVSGSTELSLYCSSANQYAFLKAYNGQEVTLEIAPCNWNNKKFYVGCVLSVITEQGKVLNRLNFGA